MAAAAAACAQTLFSQKAAKVKATMGANCRAAHGGLRIQVRNCLKSPSSYSAVGDEPGSLQPHAKCKLVALLGAAGTFPICWKINGEPRLHRCLSAVTHGPAQTYLM